MEKQLYEEGRSRHLCLFGDPIPENTYEVRMISHNRPQGLLPFTMEETPQGLRCDYYLGSLVSLKDAMDSGDTDYLYSVIFSLERLADILYEYMLEPDRLMLDPETVFLKRETGTLSFCYYPGKQETFQQSLQTLMEYFLKRLNPMEEESVLLLYGLYQRSREADVDLRSLAEFWRENRRKQEAPEEDFRQRSEQRTEERFQEEIRQGPEMRQGASGRQGSEMRQGASFRQGSEMRQGPSMGQNSEMRQGASFRQGAEMRQGASIRHGSEVRQGASMRQGSENRQGSESRRGSDMRQSGRYASPEDREILEDLGISVTDSDSPFGRWKKNREKEQASERERKSDRERNLERERFLDKEQTRDRDISLPPFGEEEFGYTASGNDSPAKQKGDKNGKAGKDKDMEKDLKTLIMQNKYEAAAVVLVLLFIIWYLVK